MISKNARISSGFVANFLLFCVVYRSVWSQIFASSVHFFALTNLDVRFDYNSTPSFFIFLAGGSSISKISPSTWTVASGVRSWWFSSILSGIGSSAIYCVSESSKRFSMSLSVSLLATQ